MLILSVLFSCAVTVLSVAYFAARLSVLRRGGLGLGVYGGGVGGGGETPPCGVFTAAGEPSAPRATVPSRPPPRAKLDPPPDTDDVELGGCFSSQEEENLPPNVLRVCSGCGLVVLGGPLSGEVACAS